MRADSRTKNTIRNASVAGIAKILVFLAQFICRTVFIKILSSEYLGVNGLFTNILLMLSFAELGMGNAIIFKLYKPIAEDDKEKIKTYVNFYKKAYITIGITILIIGCMIIPFLRYMINDAPDIKENINFVYILFLINSAISYFFTYKRSVITGYQKEYIATLIDTLILIFQNIMQIVVLLVTHSFIWYILVMILGTFLSNIICAMFANKMFPFIKDKNYKKISKKEEKNIFNDVKSLIIYKIGYISNNGIDNIVISSFLGIAEVGLLSNYTTITSAIKYFLQAFFNGFTASVGNLNVKENDERKEEIYYQIIMLSFFVYGTITISMILLFNDFINLWIGESYLLDFTVCVALGLILFVEGMRFANFTFRNTMGLFKEGKWSQLISSVVNIVLSIFLVQYLGIFGVLIATVVSTVFIATMYDPYLLHKYKFKTSSFRYYKTYIYYLILFFIALIFSKLIIEKIILTGILGFIIKGIISVMCAFIIFIIGTFKMKEFKELLEKILNNKKIKVSER